MAPVELSPTLRAHLDALDPYLEDTSVSEILVAGPDRVFVTRGGRSSPVELALGEARVRSMADRLLRAMGSRGRPERHEVQTGHISEELEVTVIGAPRGARCPLVRVLRRRASVRTLDEILGTEQLTGEVEAILRDAPGQRRTTLFCGPHGAPRFDLVIAMAQAWSSVGRVLALDVDGGALANAGVAHIVLDPDVGVDAMQAVSPDVVVAFDPGPALWVDLLRTGRPIVASVEAPDGETALSRVMALSLAGDAELSRAAAEALVESGLSILIELSATPGEPAIGRVGAPTFTPERLLFRSLTRAESRIGSLPVPPPVDTSDLEPEAEDVAPEPAPVKPPSPLGAVAITQAPPFDKRPDDTGEYVDRELNDLLPEDLVSKSFVSRLNEDGLVLVDKPSPEDTLGDPDAAPVLDVGDSALMADVEEGTQFANDADLAEYQKRRTAEQKAAEEPEDDPTRTLAGGEVMAAFDEAVEAVVDDLDHDLDHDLDEPDGWDPAVNPDARTPAFSTLRDDDDDESPLRVPNERTPTVVGEDDEVPPLPKIEDADDEAWAAEAYEAAKGVGEVDIPQDKHRDVSSPFVALEDEDGDLMTAAGLAQPSLDPFDVDAEDLETGAYDRSAELVEATLGAGGQNVEIAPPSAEDVYDSRQRPAVLTDEDDWDEDAPSEIIDGPPIVGGYGSAPKNGEDPDRTRAGSFAPDAETYDAENPIRPKKRRRAASKKPGVRKGGSAAEEGESRRPGRRRTPGRSLD